MERNENVRLVAIAFATTGPSPKTGGRISELVAVERFGDQSVGRTLHLYFKTEEAQFGKKTFSEQFELLEEFIGDSQILLHSAGIWRRFIREELRTIKKRGARKLLKQAIEIISLAHQRFPKQRKDIVSIARRLHLKVPGKEISLKEEAQLLLRIEIKMRLGTDDVVVGAINRPTKVELKAEKGVPVKRGLTTFLAQSWKVIFGR